MEERTNERTTVVVVVTITINTTATGAVAVDVARITRAHIRRARSR